jgi:Protein of unknown function (DUF1007)
MRQNYQPAPTRRLAKCGRVVAASSFSVSGSLFDDILQFVIHQVCRSTAAGVQFSSPSSVGSKRLAFAKPTEYHLEFQAERLTLFYTLPLEQALALKGDAMIEIGDPEYFVAITFVKGREVKLEGAPKGCFATYRPPHDLDMQTMAMLGSIPASQHDLPPELVQAASALSNVVTVHCPGGPNGATSVGANNAISEMLAKPILPMATLRPSEDTLSGQDKAVPPAASRP